MDSVAAPSATTTAAPAEAIPAPEAKISFWPEATSDDDDDFDMFGDFGGEKIVSKEICNSTSAQEQSENVQSSTMATTNSSDNLHCDDYFMATAVLSSYQSHDPETKVGAVIVNENNSIVATGFNDFPNKCGQAFSWKKGKKWYVVHAEANAMLNKNGASLKGTRLYTTMFPCDECAKLILLVGITKVFYISHKHKEKPRYNQASRILDRAKVQCIQYVPKETEIIIDFNDVAYNFKQNSGSLESQIKRKKII